MSKNMSALMLSLAFLLGGCGKIECQNYYNTGQEYIVQNNSGLSDEVVQKGLDFWVPAGYRFKVGHPIPGQMFIRAEQMDAKASLTLWGYSIAVDAIFWVANGAGPDVVAHEMGHIIGIQAHMDETLHPGCHLMNGTVCGVSELTPEDYQLLVEYTCD